jgi:uncharacterized protein (DUF1697 family)
MNQESPQRWVALLRAINVGKRLVKMDRLRAIFQEIGFSDVATFIASGNVIFSSTPQARNELEKLIEEHLERALGFSVPTFLRSTAELRAVIDNQPYDPAELARPGHTLYIDFMRSEPSQEAIERLMGLRTEYDELSVIGREVYWLARRSMHESKVSHDRIERALGLQGTIRNLSSVSKLVAKHHV